MSDPQRPSITRREAVLRLSSAALAGVAVGGGALAFYDRRSVVADAPPPPDWRMPGLAGAAVASRGPDPAANVRRAIAALGGIERFVRRGERVLIKPNVGWDRLPEQAANTDPDVVAELVRLCRGAGAARVVVADISCNDPRRCFARSAIGPRASEAGAEVIPGHALTLVPAALAGMSAGLEVIEELFKADRVINVPVVKHHGLSRATLGLKNWLGVLGPGRNRLHQGIHRASAELGASLRPTLTVIDATRVLTANGPQGGSLADVRTLGAVCAGTDPVTCEAWGAAQLGLEPRSLACVVEAEQRGLGRGDVALVKELGRA